MGRYPLAPRNGVPESHGTQSQVAVFPKGPREALVEAAGLNQGGTPVGHVGGNPERSAEGQSSPLDIGWTPPGRWRNIEPGLRGRHLVWQVGQVPHQSPAPVEWNRHIVVEEGNPLGIRHVPTRISGGSRAASMGVDDGEWG